ncbi:MAG: YihY/virulence factor BrkB family protein [Thermomicrobiales bacterium]
MAATQESDAPAGRDAGSSAISALRGRATVLRDSLSRSHTAMRHEHVWYAVLADIVQEIREEQPANLAKQSAYSLLYAVPSILIVLVSLAAIVDQNTGAGVSDALQRFIAEQAPGELQPLLASLVQYAVVETSEQAAIVAAIVSLVIAVWGGAGGVGALVHAINRVYDIRDSRPFFKATGLNLGLLLLDGFLVIGAFVLLTFGRRLGEWLVGIIGYGSTLVDLLLAGPVWAFFMLAGALLILYWLGPDIAQSFRWILPGTAVATLAIVAIFALMDVILTISNPGLAFGAVGSVLILLWALFLVSAIVIVGAIVNAVIGRRFDRKLAASRRQHPEKSLDRGEIVVTQFR